MVNENVGMHMSVDKEHGVLSSWSVDEILSVMDWGRSVTTNSCDMHGDMVQNILLVALWYKVKSGGIILTDTQKEQLGWLFFGAEFNDNAEIVGVWDDEKYDAMVDTISIDKGTEKLYHMVVDRYSGMTWLIDMVNAWGIMLRHIVEKPNEIWGVDAVGYHRQHMGDLEKLFETVDGNMWRDFRGTLIGVRKKCHEMGYTDF